MGGTTPLFTLFSDSKLITLFTLKTMAKTSTSRDALKYLEELRFIKTKEDHPNFPYPVKKKYKDTGTNDLTKAIIDFIDLSGGWATRISTEGRYIKSIDARIPSSVKTGTADIHACWKGMHLSIEVKVGKDTQSEVQKEVEAAIRRAGGQYFIAKTFDSFYQWINAL